MPPNPHEHIAEPPKDCTHCPRLVALRLENQRKQPDWFNGAVPSFGPDDAQLLIVGLAPGLQGANRTGRPFTGDYAGDLLYQTLSDYGFSKGKYGASATDGLTLTNCMITNAVRCLPTENKPNGAEIKNCQPFLRGRIDGLARLEIILALGKIAHDSVLRSFGVRLAEAKFAHGALHQLPDGRMLIDSYHCSRYNTNTGRLTTQMFQEVFAQIRHLLDLENNKS